MAAAQGMQLKQVIDPTLAKAFTHPLRGHVWVTICERGVASPREIAEETGIDVSEVSYHFRNLKKRKLIKLVRTVKRRGFAEHFYEAVGPGLNFDDFEWMQIPEPIRATLSADVLRQIVEEALSALAAGSFEARSRHLSRTRLSVDEQGWDELMEVVREALAQIQAIQKLCAKRLGSAGGRRIPVSVAIAAFEAATGTAPSPEIGPGPASSR